MPVNIPAALELRAAIARDRDHMHAVSNDQQLLDRHGRELFGVSPEPDLTPVEHRYVAPRNVLIEWVGQPSPYNSDVVIALKARGMLDPILLNILEQAALKCIARVDGLTNRSIGVRDGLSKTYAWGSAPGTYIVEMPAHDADRLMSIAGSEFRIREKGAVERKHEGDDAWKAVFAGLRAIAKMKGLPPPPSNAEIARIRIHVGPTERLAGIHSGNGLGDWQPER